LVQEQEYVFCDHTSVSVEVEHHCDDEHWMPHSELQLSAHLGACELKEECQVPAEQAPAWNGPVAEPVMHVLLLHPLTIGNVHHPQPVVAAQAEHE
jgi:hypothetical protein